MTVRRVLSWASRLMLVATLAAALALTWIYTLGFPPLLWRLLLRRLESPSLVLRVRRARMQFPLRLQLRKVRVYAGRVSRSPALEAELFEVEWSTSALEAWRIRPQTVTLQDVRIAGQVARGDAGMTVAQSASPRIEWAQLHFHSAESLWQVDARICWQIPLELHGFLRVDGKSVVPTGFPPEWDQALQGALEPIQDALRWLARVDMPEPPTVRLYFDVDLGDMRRTRCQLRADAPNTELWGIAPVQWHLRARWREGAWEVTRAHASWPPMATLQAQLRYEPDTQVIEGHFSGDIPLRDLADLPWPERVSAWAGRVGSAAGRVKFQLQTDTPFRWSTMSPRISGEVKITKLELATLRVHELRSAVRLDPPVLELPGCEGWLGDPPRGGPLRAQLKWDFRENRWEGFMEAAFDPTTLMALATERQALLLSSLRFPRAPPKIRARFSVSPGKEDALQVVGHIEAEEFLWNGVSVNRASADLRLDGGTVRLANLIVERPEGSLIGWLEHRAAQREVEFDAESTMHPQALARIISPFTHRLLHPFRFEGPVRMRGAGLATFEGRHDHRFDLDVSGEHMGWRWAMLDRAKFHMEARGNRIALRPFEGEWQGGTVHGEAVFEIPEPQEEPARYIASGLIQGLDLTPVLQEITDEEVPSPAGRMTLELRVEGELGEGRGRTAVGKGWVRIRDGQLMRIPLFGGLSRGLSRLSPGLGFVSQDELRADFRLANGVLYTSNAQLRGAMLSLRARGRYDLDDELRMIVEVKLLRSGWIADALRLLTWPVTRLLEFEVTGSLRRPQWTPRNVPDEIRNWFD